MRPANERITVHDSFVQVLSLLEPGMKYAINNFFYWQSVFDRTSRPNGTHII